MKTTARAHETPLTRAVVALHSGKPARGFRLLLDILRDGDPEATWACLQIVQMAFERGRSVATERLFRDSPGLDPSLRDLGIGSLLRRSGRFEEASAPLGRSLLGAPTVAADLEVAGLEAATGRIREARRRVAHAEVRARRDGDSWGVAAVAAQMAIFAVTQGELESAVALADRSAQIRATLGDRIGLGFAHQLRAKALYRMGAYAPALAALDDAKGVHLAAAHTLEAAVVLNNIGLWHLDLASPLRAVDEFRSARRFFRLLGDVSREAVVVANLANALRQLGELGRAAETYRRAIALLHHTGDYDARGIAVSELAEVESRRDRPRTAISLIEREGRQPSHAVSATTRALLELERARALVLVGDPAGALRSAATARRWVARSTDQRGRIVCAVRAGLVQARAQLNSGKTRAAASTLARTRDSLASLVGRQETAWVRVGLVEAFRETHDLLVRSLLGPQRRGARRAWAAVAGFKARELGASDTAPPRAARVHKTDRSTASVAGETTLLEYHVGVDTTHVFVVEGGRVCAIDLGVSERSLRAAVSDLIEPMRRAGSGGDAQPGLLGFDPVKSKQLCDLLFEPALATRRSSSSRVVVVPDGPLHALPFELLVRRCEVTTSRYAPAMATFDRARYVVDDLELSYARSSRLIHTPRRQRPSPAFLGLSFSPRRPAYFPTPDGVVRLASLRRAEAEVEAAAATFAATTVRHGREATVQTWRDLAPKADIIHLAAHAFADSRAPGLSGILLAGDGRDGALPAGYLSAEAVRQIPLRASLVTLSGCNSGWGAMRAREGIFGLARSFLEAGAEAVLATLWPVDDEAAFTLMSSFYRYLAAGETRATSLTRAKRDLRRHCGRHLVPQRAHPYFWAPFVLVDHTYEGHVRNVGRTWPLRAERWL